MFALRSDFLTTTYITLFGLKDLAAMTALHV